MSASLDNDETIIIGPSARQHDRNIAELLIMLPGEVIDMIAPLVMEPTWPESDSNHYVWKPQSLHVDLIDAEDEDVRAATRHALSRKTFVRLSVWKCKFHRKLPTEPDSQAPFLLPRIMTDHEFLTLQGPNGHPASTMEIEVTFDCQCGQSHETCSTVFSLDTLTTLLFIFTMKRKFFRSWYQIDVLCRIHNAKSANLTRDFLDVALRTIPVKAGRTIDIHGHPLITNPLHWSLPRLIVNPTDIERVEQNDTQMSLVEEVAERKLFLNQTWPNTINKIVEASLERCLACTLFVHKMINRNGEPLDDDTDLLLRIRIRAVTLYLQSTINSIRKHGFCQILPELRLFQTDTTRWRCFDDEHHANPFISAPHDLAVAIWIARNFRKQYDKIPETQPELLRLIGVAAQVEGLVLLALAKQCKLSSSEHGRPLYLNDIRWISTFGIKLDNQRELMTAQTCYQYASESIRWSLDHHCFQTDEERKAWLQKVGKALTDLICS